MIICFIIVFNIVFIDEKIRDLVYEKFGGKKGTLVRSKRGTTTRVVMKKTFYQGIPKSTRKGKQVAKSDEKSVPEDL